MKISGKVALVSGGASGIGKAVSSKLLEKGAKLVAILDLHADAGYKTVSEFSDKFGADRVKYIQCDVTKEDQLKNSFHEVFDVYGALDIVLNNAGIVSHNNRNTIEVNLMAVINATFIAEKLMTREKRSEKGIIINTASMAAFVEFPIGNASYTASKYGVVGFTKSLVSSTDGFSKDIRLVAICPNSVKTGILDRCNFRTTELAEKIEVFLAKKKLITLDMVVDAFVMAIENDNIHGVAIKVTDETGITVAN